MEQYLLTQEDIDRLNLTDAIAGDVATEQELRALFPAQMNEQEQLARQAETAAMEFATPQTAAIQTEEMPISYPNDYSALRDLGLDVAQTQNVLDAIQADQPAAVTVNQSDTSAFQPAFSQMTPEQLGLTQTPPALLDTIQQPAKPEDPYSNLSKTQRRMLAFAALSDAGMALQGKQGSSFSNLMRDFTLRADQARKERQAQLELEAEQVKQAKIDALLIGVTGLSPMKQAPTGDTTQMSTTERLQQEIAALQNAMPTYLQAGLVDEFKMMLQTKQDELAKATAVKEEYDIDLEQATGQIQSTEQALRVAERALTAAGKYDSVEQMLSSLKAGEYDPSSFFITRQGVVPDTKQFRDFQSFAEQFSSIMTFQNLQAILATGAKLGTLSDADLKAIGAISGPMDAVNNPRQTAQNIQFAYEQLMEELEQQEEKLAELKLKGY